MTKLTNVNTEHFKTLINILKIFDNMLDLEEIDEKPLTAKALNISEIRRIKYFDMLQSAGLITGVEFNDYTGDGVKADISKARITIEGMEYLYNL